MPINSPHILVVGGAGYIGSHMAWLLEQKGFKPIILDNVVKGHAQSVSRYPLFIGDMDNKQLLQSIFDQYEIKAVMHFAAYIEVGESINFPLKYYQNNVAATLNLLATMLKNNIKYFIFSSTASVYGQPQYVPIDEAHPLQPINPYGKSKLMVEHIIKDLARSDGLQYAILRYFNAAGAHPDAGLGERHEPESHLIPLVLQAASGKREAITIYGDDYPTKDKTCIRDYIHVLDLAEAHLLALQFLLTKKLNSLCCNLGTGQGYSVLEVIENARKISQREIKTINGKRREGDPAVLVADASYAKKILNWAPTRSDLSTIIYDAWRFMLY